MPFSLTTSDARAAAAFAAFLLAVTGRGDVFLLAGLLAIAGPPAARAVPVLSFGAVAVRWGTSSLGAIGGAQAALGAGGWVGPPAAAAACWCAAAAIVVAAPRSFAAVASGVAAAFVVAGPAPGDDGGRVALRIGAAVAGALVAALCMRVLPGRVRVRLAWLTAAVAVGLALAA